MNELNTFFQDISLRRRVIIQVVMLSVLIVVTGLYGLIAVVETKQRLHKSVLEGKGMIKAVNTARLAEVHFKKQVQEWKNILLRGNDQALYKQHFQAFENEERLVNESLKLLEGMAAVLKITVPQIDEAIKVHEQLGRRYREALKSYRYSDLKSAVMVDKIVRGIDREPTNRIDQIVESIRRQSEGRLSDMEMMAQTKLEIYQGLAFFMIFLVLAGLGFGMFSARSIINDMPSQGKDPESDDL
jgi:methyl-accepting chemotaxis protein